MKYLINYIINPIKEHFRYKRNYTKTSNHFILISPCLSLFLELNAEQQTV